MSSISHSFIHSVLMRHDFHPQPFFPKQNKNLTFNFGLMCGVTIFVEHGVIVRMP